MKAIYATLVTNLGENVLIVQKYYYSFLHLFLIVILNGLININFLF
jgi:hypothetical protein